MGSGPEERRPKGRLEAFSDGVFAIAITLLVIEITVPAVSGDRLLSELLHEWPIYLGYFIAFMMIGVRWMEHSDLTDGLEYVDAVFMRLNLLLMLFVAFLPFPARLMADYADDTAGERVAVVFFGLVLLLQSLSLWLLVRHAERQGLFGADIEEKRIEETRVRYQLTPSLVFYGIATAIGLLSPRLAVFLYLVIAFYLAVPLQVVRRVLGRGDEG